MTEINSVFVRLEGAVQSYGLFGRWEIRDTAQVPTKSAIVGICAAALGLTTKDEALIVAISRAIRLGVRVNRSGILYRDDYHAITEGVERTGGWGSQAKITRRDYLCDAAFTAVIQSSDTELIRCLAEALLDPYYDIYLGRKANSPAMPLFDGVGNYADLVTALRSHPWYAREVDRELRVNTYAVVDCKVGEGMLQRDEVVSFARQQYYSRFVKRVDMPLIVRPWEQHKCTYPEL